MVVAIPLDEGKVESEMSISFGRCSYFLIKDSNSNSNIIENTAIKESGGAGIKAAQLLIDSKVDVLITLSIGAKAIDVLKMAGIKIYEGQGRNIEDNLKALKNGSLKELNSANK